MGSDCTVVDKGIIAIAAEAYSTESHLRELDIKLEGLANRVCNFAKSWIREIHYGVTTGIVTMTERLYGAPIEYVIPSSENNQWKPGNKGLYVAIHGLNGRPNVWRDQLSLLREQQSEFEIRLPHVPRKGNCSLEEAVGPIEAMIRDYIEKHPGQPVCLMGVSNGARIVAELEVRLRDTKTPIKVSSVAGAISGTKQINLMQRFGLATKIYTSALVNEMLYQSEAAQKLLRRMQAALPEGVERAYDFYSSPNDFQISPYTGSLPVLNQENVRYFLAPGENHNSIVSRISVIQVKHCVDWMQEHVIKL
ncbi:MAG: hypothetical protein K940chlam8_01171 [Chlamydiae bacterium]|nr:hypothetical protein [Chlamydiota bacterium]